PSSVERRAGVRGGASDPAARGRVSLGAGVGRVRHGLQGAAGRRAAGGGEDHPRHGGREAAVRVSAGGGAAALVPGPQHRAVRGCVRPGRRGHAGDRVYGIRGPLASCDAPQPPGRASLCLGRPRGSRGAGHCARASLSSLAIHRASRPQERQHPAVSRRLRQDCRRWNGPSAVPLALRRRRRRGGHLGLGRARGPPRSQMHAQGRHLLLRRGPVGAVHGRDPAAWGHAPLASARGLPPGRGRAPARLHGPRPHRAAQHQRAGAEAAARGRRRALPARGQAKAGGAGHAWPRKRHGSGGRRGKGRGRQSRRRASPRRGSCRGNRRAACTRRRADLRPAA
ncbi:hypothetical protein H632_c3982p0, partial [Helicosporidium sp. ATCC 50920]